MRVFFFFFLIIGYKISLLLCPFMTECLLPQTTETYGDSAHAPWLSFGWMKGRREIESRTLNLKLKATLVSDRPCPRDPVVN